MTTSPLTQEQERTLAALRQFLTGRFEYPPNPRDGSVEIGTGHRSVRVLRDGTVAPPARDS